MTRLLLVLSLLVAAPGDIVADELDDLLARFEAERSEGPRKRFGTASRIGRLGGDRARDALIDLHGREQNAQVKARLVVHLGRHAGEAVDRVLVESLADDPDVRLAAIRVIADRMNLDWARRLVDVLCQPKLDQDARKAVRDALASVEDEATRRWVIENGTQVEDPAGRRALAVVLGAYGTEAAHARLEALFGDGDPVVRRAALEGMIVGDHPRLLEILKRMVGARDAEVSVLSIRSLARFAPGDESVRRMLFELLDGRDLERRLAAADALGQAGLVEAIDRLARLLTQRQWQLRAAAAINLGRIEDRRSIDVLVERLPEEEGRVRGDILQALASLTGQAFGDSIANWQSWWNKNRESFDFAARGAPAAGARESEVGYFGIPLHSKRVVFLLDGSLSMKGPFEASDPRYVGGGDKGPTKIEAAKAQLVEAIGGLAADVAFDILFFDAEFARWQGRLVPASRQAKAQAIDYVGKRELVFGTNIYDSLVDAIETRGVDTVFILTDGMPIGGTYDDPADILREIGHLNQSKRVKINAIYIGKGDNAFLRQLAGDSGGSYAKP